MGCALTRALCACATSPALRLLTRLPLLQLPAHAVDAAQKAVASCLEAARAEYGAVEPGLSLALEAGGAAPGGRVLCQADVSRLLDLLLLLPHGPVKMCGAMPGGRGVLWWRLLAKHGKERP